MNNFKLILLAASLVMAGCTGAEGDKAQKPKQAVEPVASHRQADLQKQKPDDHHGHDHAADNSRIPAFETDPKNLPATLAPESFTGMTRKAYEAVREIPETIAQLPCYCHCDRGYGHKSLHSCFVDNHASNCAVCVEEALVAYRMEKELKLAPAEIRERIIEHYSKNQ